MIFRSLPERLSEAEIDEMLKAADTDGDKNDYKNTDGDKNDDKNTDGDDENNNNGNVRACVSASVHVCVHAHARTHA